MTGRNVIDIEDRIPKLKEKRRQRSNRRLILYLSLFFILITIVVYLQSSFSRVKEVNVTGNELVSSEWIIETSRLLEDVSMWNIETDQIIKSLLKHPVLADVTITREWLNTVNIQVDEYERIAYIEEGNVYHPLLNNGHIVELGKETVVSPYDAPILIDFSDDELKQVFANELANVKDSIAHRISEVHYSPVENDRYRLIIYMNDGFVVHSTVKNFAERIAPYPSVVEQLDPQMDGIIHMRMNPYFESFEMEEDEEGESEG